MTYRDWHTARRMRAIEELDWQRHWPMNSRAPGTMAPVSRLLICNPLKRDRGRRGRSVGSPWTVLGSVRFKNGFNCRAVSKNADVWIEVSARRPKNPNKTDVWTLLRTRNGWMWRFKHDGGFGLLYKTSKQHYLLSKSTLTYILGFPSSWIIQTWSISAELYHIINHLCIKNCICVCLRGFDALKFSRCVMRFSVWRHELSPLRRMCPN